MQDFINHAYNWATIHWPAILALVGGGAGVSVLLETLLRKLHVDSKKVAYTLLHVFSVITAVAAFYVASLPNKDIAPVYASLALLAETWHRFILSPLYNKYLIPFLQYQADTKQAKLPVSTVTETPVEAEPNPFA